MEGKLVRDGIPDIIRVDGGEPSTHILDEAAYLDSLDEKLKEELTEFLDGHDLIELADLLEVIRASAEARGSSYEEVEALRHAKFNERGGFGDRVFLETE